ncbi:Uncharacterised protein [Enterobacter cloacae]|nr:Uncharacterised protein [Enterobacter cloacae]
MPPRSNWVRRLKTVSAAASKSVPVVYWAGSKPAGLPSEQKIRLLAKAWGTAATSAAPSSEGMIAERMTAFLRME